MSTSVQHRRPGLKTLLSSLQPLDIPSPITKEERAFALFPNLPPELRRQIWGHVASEPRIIYLFHTDKYSPSRSENTTRSSQTTYPAILATSQESRSEGLRFYTPYMQLGSSHWTNKGVTYINLGCDRFRSSIYRFLEQWAAALPKLRYYKASSLLNGGFHHLEFLDTIPCLEVEMNWARTLFPTRILKLRKLGRSLALIRVSKVALVLLLLSEDMREAVEGDLSGVKWKVDRELELREIFLQQVAEWGVVDLEITVKWGTGVDPGVDPSRA
ncbi:hypothetical protein L207DRAFT_618018 [Hyaloscypha variabilis F]|uniref:2EXR domain-containing protein n=1 Tax=Hyaloscypha variabilis (strain UAMH 11265 / GT02V1 / F) TaxID=1149755 RepID=A0A2J6QSB8_HYAVF|nr:hypothetical protein L207DRAFT_618018 [Hyaloscypha variabilis F]